MPLFNNNTVAMAQEYDDYYRIVLIANIQPRIKNMNVGLVHLRASLYLRWNSVNMLNLR